MGEPEKRWQQRIEEFVLGQIGDPPARVLEVGCGEGELARAMARAGHCVTAIDPRAPEGPLFQRVRIEEFSDPDPFDYVVAILSLHHVEDLGSALDKIAKLLRAGGALVVVERLHTSRQMRGELGRRFIERLFAWVPYLYPDLDDDTSEADESAAIEAGAINATGFRYVGTLLALEGEPFQAR
jgi:2-polyprenyl-3-methyl-5-hydroxy-6-metoxy-1,4-benzoquinol methylase